MARNQVLDRRNDFQLRIYRKSSHEQPAMGDHPDWGLGVGLTILQCKRIGMLQGLTGASNFDGFI
jgi:hypothetical protein